jgi:hypothetical protein
MILLLVIVLLLAMVLSTLRRATRRLRRIPCVVCGCPLLPAARSCPSCRNRQPLRGWAGRRERMWQPIRTNLTVLAARPRRPIEWPVVMVIGAGLVIVVFAGLCTLMASGDPAPLPPTWDLQSDGSYKIHRPQGPLGYDPCEPIKDAKQREFCRGHGPDPTPAPTVAAGQSSSDPCQQYATEQQRNAAQSMIRQRGHFCKKVDAMCPYILSEGATVYCDDYRYVFEIENHGGIWSVKAP